MEDMHQSWSRCRQAAVRAWEGEIGYEELEAMSGRLEEAMFALDEEDRLALAEAWGAALESEAVDMDREPYFYLLTALAGFTGRPQEAGRCLEALLEENWPRLAPEGRYGGMWQLYRYAFLGRCAWDGNCQDVAEGLYGQIVGAYGREVEALGQELAWIPQPRRNPRFCLVLVGQFLQTAHGPTKTALDRCSFFLRSLSITPLLVNTAEMYGGNVRILAREVIGAAYMEENLERDRMEWKGVSIPYFQFQQNMPNARDMADFLAMLAREKPLFALSLGAMSPLADLVAALVPVITQNTVPSQVAICRSQWQVLGRPIGEEDLAYERRWHRPGHMLYAPFTFDFVPNGHSGSREALGLPEEAFVVHIVGTRLQQECDGDFLELLERLMDAGAYIMALGQGEVERPWWHGRGEIWRQRFRPSGLVLDILSYHSLGDVYLNPRRRGGRHLGCGGPVYGQARAEPGFWRCGL